LTDALPRPISEDSGQGTLLRRTNILIPASSVRGVSKDALMPGWDANAVVAAEDRPDLDRANVYVRDDVNYAGHAAAAIATAAALWSGIDQGGLDVLDTDSTSMDTDVAVVRHAVRAIVRSNDVQELADAACQSIVTDPSAAARTVEWARPAAHPGAVVDSVFAEIMATGDWVTRTPAEQAKPERAERRFSASREAAIFNAQLFSLGLKATVGMGRRAVENVATAAIVGQEGDFVLRFHPSSSSSMALQAQALLDSQSVVLNDGNLIDEADSVTAPDPRTWVDLRRSCFGLVDGSPLPGGYKVPVIAGKPQLLPPSSVVPDPADTFVTPDGAVIRSCDAQLAAEYLSTLRVAAGVPTPEPTTDSGATAAAHDVSSRGEPLADNADVSSSDEAKTPAETVQQTAERRRAKEGLADLEKWTGARKSALVWRIHESVSRQAAQSHAEAQRAYAAATATTQFPAEALRRSQRRLVVGWSVLGFVFAALSLYLWHWHYQLGQMTTSELVKAITELAVTSLLLGVIFNHLFFMAVHHYELMVERDLASRRRTAELYVVAQLETRRLQLLGSRLNEWAEIIGGVLHRPWTPQPAESAETAVGTLTHLPAAVAVAVPPQQTSEISPVVMARTIQVLRSQGWANQGFDDAVAAYESNVRNAHDGGHLAADLDTLHGPTSPLGLLWAFFVTGEAGTYATAFARARIEKALADGDLELPPRSVRRVGEYADGETVSDAQFFSGALHAATPFVGDLWTPTGLMNHKNVPDKSVVWMPRAAGPSLAESLIRHPANGDVAMRVDISRRCDISDLRVFSTETMATSYSPEPEPATDRDF
jgi:hypothetical protein